MNLARLLRAAIVPAAALTLLAGQAALDGATAAGTTPGHLTVSTASLKAGQLTVEGSGAATGFISASSTTSAAGARAGLDGRFKIRATGFTAPDCRVVLQDNKSALLTVTLSGCTPTIKPVTPPAGPSGTCVITPPAGPSTLAVNQMGVVWFATTGCNTTAGDPFGTPVKWAVVAGAVPTGMTPPASQGQTGGNIIGTPTVPGTYQFTLQVTDSAGQTDQESYTVTVG
jgi:Putative Ig domain